MTNGYRECDCDIDIKQLERKNAALVADNERLREALERITDREGAFSLDPLEHCSNAIENMAAIAVEALTAAGTEEK